MSTLRKINNILENFGSHKVEKSILEEQNIKRDDKNVVGKNSDIENQARDNMSRRIP